MDEIKVGDVFEIRVEVTNSAPANSWVRVTMDQIDIQVGKAFLLAGRRVDP